MGENENARPARAVEHGLKVPLALPRLGSFQKAHASALFREQIRKQLGLSSESGQVVGAGIHVHESLRKPQYLRDRSFTGKKKRIAFHETLRRVLKIVPHSFGPQKDAACGSIRPSV